MNSTRQTILNAIDTFTKALFEHWDPIGVNNTPAVRNEYKNYAPTALILAAQGDAEKLASFLTHIRTERIGCLPDQEADQRAAKLLLEKIDRI